MGSAGRRGDATGRGRTGVLPCPFLSKFDDETAQRGLKTAMAAGTGLLRYNFPYAAERRWLPDQQMLVGI